MRSLLPLVGLLILQPLFADKISLKNGESFEGDFFGATSQEIRFVVDGKLMNFATTQVTMIQFGDAVPSAPASAPAPKPAAEPPATPPPTKTAATSPTAPRAAQTAKPAARPPVSTASGKQSSSDRPTIRRHETESVDPEPASGPATGETASRTDSDERPAELPDDFSIPRGTRLDVRLNEAIDSTIYNSGQTYDAELIHPVVVRGKVIAPEGTLVTARMVEDYQPGNGRSDPDRNGGSNEDYEVITVDLIAILINGQQIPIRTNEVQRRIMASKKERAMEGLSRAGRELGTILTGSMGGAAGRTGQDTAEDVMKPRGGEIARGTVLQFVVEDEIGGISADQFTE